MKFNSLKNLNLTKNVIMKKLLTVLFLFSVSFGFGESRLAENSRIAPEIEQTFNIEEATLDYLNTLTDEQKESSDAYFEGGYWLLLWGLLIDIFIAWLFLAKGLSQRIKNFASKVSSKVNLQNLVYLACYMVVSYVLVYPWNVYTSFFREHQYDLSNQTFLEWMGDELKGLLLFVLFGGTLFMCLYIAIRKVGRTWWVWGSGITFIFLVLVMFIAPVFISPLFNDYKPLEGGPVKESILTMARANGVPVDNVYMFDASRQSDRISANVSGIGGTIRISLNDNLLNKSSEGEIKAVMGHELGHYVLNHVYEGLIMFSLVFLVGFAFVNWAFGKVLNTWGQNWCISGLSDVAGFPLIMVLLSVFFVLAEPATNSIIRTNETEADIFGLNAAKEPDGFASAAMKLSTYRKISPGYFERLLFYDHPSGYDRVLMSMTWKAENLVKEEILKQDQTLTIDPEPSLDTPDSE